MTFPRRLIGFFDKHGFRAPRKLIFILAYSLRREFEEKTGNSKTV